MVYAARRGGCIEMLTLATGLPEEQTLDLIRKNDDALAGECARIQMQESAAAQKERSASLARTRRRLAANPWLRISSSIRGQVAYALKRGNAKRQKGLFRQLGYSPEALKAHLERLMQPEMNWDNYGPVWHIDHVRPVSWFDFRGRDVGKVLRECWALDNLQPLFAHANLSKGNRYEG